jgi:hypothetical protein
MFIRRRIPQVDDVDDLGYENQVLRAFFYAGDHIRAIVCY